MSWGAWLLWGFVGTVVLTTLLSASQGLGVTRMNLPYILGTCVTPDRDRATLWGVALHVLFGWVLSLVYILVFEYLGLATWWLGAIAGLLHGAFVLSVVLPAMPGLHPRMASVVHGPTVTRQLEPPGFAGLNYGVQTPVAILAAHVLFGAVLGAGY